MNQALAAMQGLFLWAFYRPILDSVQYPVVMVGRWSEVQAEELTTYRETSATPGDAAPKTSRRRAAVREFEPFAFATHSRRLQQSLRRDQTAAENADPRLTAEQVCDEVISSRASSGSRKTHAGATHEAHIRQMRERLCEGEQTGVPRSPSSKLNVLHSADTKSLWPISPASRMASFSPANLWNGKAVIPR